MTWARNGVLFMALSLCALTTGAQEAEPTTFGVWTAQMQTIARNNASLRALHSSLEATRLANGADNALPDPEAEVAYMFGSPKGVPNRTNVAVTQTPPGACSQATARACRRLPTRRRLPPTAWLFSGSWARPMLLS